MSEQLTQLIATAIKLQRVAYNAGHENQGASIDVMAYILREFASNPRQQRNRRVQTLVSEIQGWNETNDALKYAKPLAQNTRFAVRRAVLSRD